MQLLRLRSGKGGGMRRRRGKDRVNRPGHYTFGSVEVIDAIEAWGLGFHLGNVVKYIARADHKGSRSEDLKKARWYLDRQIKKDAANRRHRGGRQ